MRKIVVTGSLPLEQKEVWKYYEDIKSYPSRVKFLTKVIVVDPVKLGGRWFDVTKVLWIPAKFEHIITVYEPPNKIGFEVLNPAGKMFHVYSLEGSNNGTKVKAEIEFTLTPIVDILIGSILEKRLTLMLEASLKNIKKEILEAS